MKPVLYCVGTPLNDCGTLHPQVSQILSTAQLIIGESAGTTKKFAKQAGISKDCVVTFVDPPNPAESELQTSQLKKLAQNGGTAVLLSDSGLPILFDPGLEILKLARTLQFEIRAAEGSTSWGTAAALSGFSPPFWLEGFLPRESEKREGHLKGRLKTPAHLILMDTPYRFHGLLKDLERLAPKRECFLAWNLTQPAEHLLWGTPAQLRKQTEALHLSKGEFVIVISTSSR